MVMEQLLVAAEMEANKETFNPSRAVAFLQAKLALLECFAEESARDFRLQKNPLAVALEEAIVSTASSVIANGKRRSAEYAKTEPAEGGSAGDDALSADPSLLELKAFIIASIYKSNQQERKGKLSSAILSLRTTLKLVCESEVILPQTLRDYDVLGELVLMDHSARHLSVLSSQARGTSCPFVPNWLSSCSPKHDCTMHRKRRNLP